MSRFRIAVVVMTIFATVAIAVIDFHYFPAFKRQAAAAKSYRGTSGTILQSDIQARSTPAARGEETLTSQPQLRYSYVVEGQLYESTRYRHESSSRSAQAVVNSFTEGATVPVFYDPGDPREAVLSTTMETGDWLHFALIICLNVLVAFSWAYAIFGRGKRTGKRKTAPAPAF